MHYQVLPLFYAANEYFKNTIHFCLELTEEVDPAGEKSFSPSRYFSRAGILHLRAR